MEKELERTKIKSGVSYLADLTFRHHRNLLRAVIEAIGMHQEYCSNDSTRQLYDNSFQKCYDDLFIQHRYRYVNEGNRFIRDECNKINPNRHYAVRTIRAFHTSHFNEIAVFSGQMLCCYSVINNYLLNNDDLYETVYDNILTIDANGNPINGNEININFCEHLLGFQCTLINYFADNPPVSQKKRDLVKLAKEMSIKNLGEKHINEPAPTFVTKSMSVNLT